MAQSGYKREYGWMLGIGLGVLGGMVLPMGCSRSGAEKGQVELVVWSAPTGPEEKGFLRLCRRFEQEHPSIKVHNVGASTEEKLVRAIVAATPPDLAYIYGTTTLGPLAAHSALQPLNTFFARSGLKESDFLPGAIQQGYYQGSLYAMPVTRDSRGLYWNRTRFREAGLDPDTPPKTLEELMSFAKRLTSYRPDGSVEKLGVFLPEDPTILFAQFGGEACDRQTGKITANRPENIAALHWMVELADAQGGYRAFAAFKSGFGREDSGQNPLATGKVALRMNGEWGAMHIEKFAPNTDYSIGEMPYPASRPDLKNLAWQDGDIMVIPTGSHHPEAAWEFMRWMQLPAQQEEYAILMNNLPSILALRDSPRLSQGSHSRRVLGYVFSHIASNAKNAHFFPSLPTTQLYRNALQDAFDRALYHEKTPEKALNDVQTRLEREEKRY